MARSLAPSPGAGGLVYHLFLCRTLKNNGKTRNWDKVLEVIFGRLFIFTFIQESSHSILKMDRPKFILNPNAAPFIPSFKKATEIDFEEVNEGGKKICCDSATNVGTKVYDKFDSAWQPSSSDSQKILISDEDFQRIDYHIPETEDDVHHYETLGFEQDLQDSSSSQIELDFLSSLFPNFSVESVNEVYHACGNVDEAKLMLEQLEGHDGSSHGLPDDPHFSAAGPSGHKNAI